MGDQIIDIGTAASITETIDKILPDLENKMKDNLSVSENLCIMPSAVAPIVRFEREIASKLLANSESWLGLNQTHLDKLKEFQDRFLRRVFQVSQSGRSKGMLELNGHGQVLSMKWRIVERRLQVPWKQWTKTMTKNKH